MQTHNPNRRGLTLLELLVVIAILAILGGSILVAYDGLEAQAAKGAATFNINGVDRAVRTFTVSERSAPSQLDSLIAANWTQAVSETGLPDDPLDAVQTGAEPLFNLGSKIAGKILIADGDSTDASGNPVGDANGDGLDDDALLTDAEAQTLVDAGVTELRYVDVLGNVNPIGGSDVTLDAFIDDGSAQGVLKAESVIDIPNRVFDTPRPGGAKRRGRGYSASVDTDPATAGAQGGQPVMIWKPGTAGINNIKVGAKAGDRLVVFGLGNTSTMVGATNESAGVGNVTLSEAPYYGDVKKDEYGRFMLLYNVSASPAKLQAVIDARGDFLDEEHAEATGQKK